VELNNMYINIGANNGSVFLLYVVFLLYDYVPSSRQLALFGYPD